MKRLLLKQIQEVLVHPLLKYAVTDKSKALRVSSEDVNKIKENLKDNKPKNKDVTVLYASDHRLVDAINQKTAECNRNNVTRTHAYYTLYKRNPELHWAFLAHLVSRNAGWTMTDLKGEYLPSILSKKDRNAFFEFFERSNALIFQDAYPQLLLYEESKAQGRNLFYLLPKFYVSRFMRPFWERFLKEQRSPLLTIALIINEQHYIEQRVIHNSIFKETVFQTLQFKVQAALQLSTVTFPYQITTYIPFLRRDNRLAGATLADFTNLSERIEIGKELYGLVFGIEEIYDATHQFASEQLHTGSRQDYWPMLFSSKRGSSKVKKLKGCRLADKHDPIYSPKLTDVWEDRPIAKIARFDWYHDESVLHYFKQMRKPRDFDKTARICLNLRKLEMAAYIKEELG